MRAADIAEPPVKIIGKPIRASDKEVSDNPRARSAILRTAERTGIAL